MSATSSTSVLAGFQLTRVLDQDAKTRTAALLGTFDGVEAILLLEKTHFSAKFFETLGETADSEPEAKKVKTGDSDEVTPRLQHISRLRHLGQNDIYTWLLAWRRELTEGGDGDEEVDADMKINMIKPATAAHIKKYERQEKVMIYGEARQERAHASES